MIQGCMGWMGMVSRYAATVLVEAGMGSVWTEPSIQTDWCVWELRTMMRRQMPYKTSNVYSDTVHDNKVIMSNQHDVVD